MAQNGGSAVAAVVEKAESELMEVDMSVKSLDDDDVDAIIEEDANDLIEMDEDEDVEKYIEEDEDIDGATMNYDDLVVEDDGESLSNGGGSGLVIKDALSSDEPSVVGSSKVDGSTSNGIGTEKREEGEVVEKAKAPPPPPLTIRPVVAAESNGYASNNNKVGEDYERPVSIPSDSQSEGEDEGAVIVPVPVASAAASLKKAEAVVVQSTTIAATAKTTATPIKMTKNHNGTCDVSSSEEVHEILSDKEDCVVIEDTTPPNKAAIAALQSANRARKASMRMREYDDDIQEIPDEDPVAINSTTTIQPVSKKMKLGGGGGGSSALNLSAAQSSQFSGLPADLSITAGAANKDGKFVMVDHKALLNPAQSKKQLGDVTNLLAGGTPPGLTISHVTGGGGGGGQGSSPSGANIRATITPISGSNSVSSSNNNINSNRGMTSGGNNLGSHQQQHQQQQNNLSNMNASNALSGGLSNILLPALTDDMFVLEAPSFIVPYIYEKPPSENLRQIVDDIKKELDALKVKDGPSERDLLLMDKKRREAALAAASDEGKEDEDDDEEGGGKGEEGEENKKKRGNRHGKGKNPDDSWGESDESTDDDASDTETRTKVLIKEVDTKNIESILLPGENRNAEGAMQRPSASDNYFESPLGQFFMNIGMSMVQEHVQADLLRLQKRKQQREGGKPNVHLQTAINNLMKNLESSRKDNETFKFPWKRCDFCNFKSESGLAMANHYEKPHLKANMYKCNFCTFEARPAHDILFHMEAVHNMKSKLEKPLSYHQCPNCPFEDNGKSKLARHTIACTKKFLPENNLLPAQDWDPPAKIPRVKPRHGLVGTATAYQAMAAQQQRMQQMSRMPGGGAAGGMQGAVANQLQAANMMNQANAAMTANAALSLLNSTNMAGLMSGNVANNLGMGGGGGGKSSRKQNHNSMMQGGGGKGSGSAMRNANIGGGMANQSRTQQQQQQMVNALLLQNNFNQLAAAAGVKNLNSSQLLQIASQAMMPNAHSSLTIQQSNQATSKSSKNQQQPSISITPLPRQSSGMGGGNSGGGSSSGGRSSSSSSGAAGLSGNAGGLGTAMAGAAGMPNPKPGQHPSGGKSSFVICEICDGYIKDLDQLRSHMQLIHKVKIHPKMIYNRPPLNCQKCQYRFFTDQGLERHLLGSHGLVTSSMQEAANCGQDSGRCPICGRVYQWKLLNHVSRDHNMTLKPAHLSYKCTVCTATFGMYKQFENHVYSAHSTVAKKSGDKKASSSSSSGFGGASSKSSSGGDSLLKPLKINDEITIIPQPPTKMSKTQTIEIE